MSSSNWTNAAIIGAAAIDMGEDASDRRAARKMAKKANSRAIYNYQNRYQWQMEDMRKAGLNPILAYKQTAPAVGQAAQAQNFSHNRDRVGKALALNAQASQIQQANSAAKVANANAKTVDERRQGEVDLGIHSAEAQRLENVQLQQEIDWLAKPENEKFREAFFRSKIGGNVGQASAAGVLAKDLWDRGVTPINPSGSKNHYTWDDLQKYVQDAPAAVKKFLKEQF